MKALSEFLRPEFLNRVDEIITFNSLTPENFKEIAVIMLDDLKKTLADKFISFSYTVPSRVLLRKRAIPLNTERAI